MTSWFELLYIINLCFVWFSWRVAMHCFENDNTKAGWLNIFASALNAAIIMDHFI
jgi:hypothetical protein